MPDAQRHIQPIERGQHLADERQPGLSPGLDQALRGVLQLGRGAGANRLQLGLALGFGIAQGAEHCGQLVARGLGQGGGLELLASGSHYLLLQAGKRVGQLLVAGLQSLRRDRLVVRRPPDGDRLARVQPLDRPCQRLKAPIDRGKAVHHGPIAVHLLHISRH